MKKRTKLLSENIKEPGWGYYVDLATGEMLFDRVESFDERVWPLFDWEFFLKERAVREYAIEMFRKNNEEIAKEILRRTKENDE